MQVWEMDLEDQEALLTPDELKIFDNFYKVIDTKAETLLQSDEELLKELKQNNSPLPFELVFNHELDEISKNRLLRYQEQCLSGFEQVNEVAAPSTEINDPFAKAANMKLFALAFSGGGIRSATFNLGILQGLAKKGLINKFDYLSTVSGGGYIGSWLAAWIKRDGSVTKVSDRLNPEKSPDPFGEELRPIRWLRMFSNYFTPEASIMSVDAWTVGVTWLRNTLLNQLIILLLFLSILLSINIFYKIWIIDIWKGEITNRHVYFWSLILILPVALLAGLGMQSYHGERFPPVAIKREETGKVSTVILIILFAGAYMVSAWLFSNSDTSYFFIHKNYKYLYRLR
ncbi:MAG: patatin-like phospholipase family protein [Segetibacter sp.]